MAMSAELEALRTVGLVDAGVLAVGVERAWASADDVAASQLNNLLLVRNDQRWSS